MQGSKCSPGFGRHPDGVHRSDGKKHLADGKPGQM
jgi:hypothetical protein